MINIISGPCSAESEEQVFATASALSKLDCSGCGMKMTAFRAGLWKPRTHPGSFEGVGVEGLPWLVRVQKELGLKVIVEVASPAHVESVLKAGLDMVWIGARTTTNPFAMQDIADSLMGVDIPVFVKNPMNPDLELWIGAVERVLRAGVPQVCAIHRGFSFYEKIRYRNMPKWQVAVDFMQRLPQVPLYCDPSHISGSREYLAEVSQRALDLGFGGLFIESHCNPSAALSDSAQQVTPAQLEAILRSLTVKHSDSDDEATAASMKEIRARIDVVDENILDMLAARMELVDEIGSLKHRHNMTVLQQARWEEIIRKMSEGASLRGLDEDFVRELFKLVHQAAIDRQS